MAPQMKILGLRIKHYRQFRNFHLNLATLDDGSALAKICLIGANGTGKSTLLHLISLFLQNGQPDWLDKRVSQLSAIAIHIQLNHQRFWILKHHFSNPAILPDTLSHSNQWLDF